VAQVFGRWANPIARIVLVGAAVGVIVLCGAAIAYVRAPGATGVGITVEQPVPFSHKHHVGGLGIDCRYCHTSVERSAFAGLPPTETCMTCHSQIWTNAAMLAPVRTSLRDDEPLRWNRVNNLPDYVYFNHSIHIAKGVACESCHGRVDQMPLMSKGQPLSMGWCLDCHRDPAPHLRPKEDVFEMGWTPPAGESRRALGSRLVKAYHIHVKTLTHCSVCHR
jgi:hypothetical protein